MLPLGVRDNAASSKPEKLGQSFTPLGDGNREATNLSVFYHLGKGIKGIGEIEPGTPLSNLVFALFEARGWLFNLVTELEGIDMPDTAESVKGLLQHMDSLADFRHLVIPIHPLEGPRTTRKYLMVFRHQGFRAAADMKYTPSRYVKGEAPSCLF